MEQLRIEQEKAKRNTTIIEEVYTRINEIDFLIHHDIIYRNLESLMETGENIERVQTLIYLYLPSVRNSHKDYEEKIYAVIDKMEEAESSTVQDDPGYITINHTDVYFRYKQSQSKLMESLEKLVR